MKMDIKKILSEIDTALLAVTDKTKEEKDIIENGTLIKDRVKALSDEYDKVLAQATEYAEKYRTLVLGAGSPKEPEDPTASKEKSLDDIAAEWEEKTFKE